MRMYRKGRLALLSPRLRRQRVSSRFLTVSFMLMPNILQDGGMPEKRGMCSGLKIMSRLRLLPRRG